MSPSRPATLLDVARLAGVSKATASKALNGDYPVAAATRARVTTAAQRLGFTPSALATSLVTGRSRTVGLLVLDDRLERFVTAISLGIEDTLRTTDLALLLANVRGDRARLEPLLAVLHARRADGLIVVGDNNVVWPSITDQVDRPVVYAYCQTDRSDDVCHLPDDEAATGQIIDHLVASGRRRFAHVTGPAGSLSVRARIRGIRVGLRRHGLALSGPPLHGPWSQRWGRQAVGQLLDHDAGIDAIVCGSDQIAYGVSTALEPTTSAVAVTGFDNWAPFAEETAPPLTTVDSNLEALGRASAEDLFALIDGRPVTGGVRRHPCRLVIPD